MTDAEWKKIDYTNIPLPVFLSKQPHIILSALLLCGLHCCLCLAPAQKMQQSSVARTNFVQQKI